MYYGEIKYNDIANGLGVRTSLFVSGCRNHCPGCFQPETWDFNYGKEFTKDEEKDIINSMNKYISGITILGGDPFELENATVLLKFIKKFKKACPDKSIWVYTGYTYEYLRHKNKTFDKVLENIDVLVDGPFILNQKNIRLKFRGSENQRIIDVKKTIETNSVVLYLE